MTMPWSPRVGQLWVDAESNVVAIAAEHVYAGLVLIKHEAGSTWINDFDERFEPLVCESCGAIKEVRNESRQDPAAPAAA